MKRFFGFIMVAIAMFLEGCLGTGGSSAPAPNNVAVAAKDSRVIVTWDSVPGVTYWVFTAAGTGVTPLNCSSMPSCGTTLYATSPQTISTLPGIYGTYGTVPLSNGTQYSFTVNGRISGGPGGPGSPALQATPRLAGGTGTWTVGTPTIPNTSDLRGVAYGGWFVAAGTSGALFSSADGKTWTALASPAPYTTTNFDAVTYDSLNGTFLCAGQTGTVIGLTPATSSVGTLQTSGTTLNELFAITNNGAGFIVATGASGTILIRNAGTWAPATTNPALATGKTLYSVTYGTSTTLGNIFVAVGQSGTVLYSTDGLNWTAANTGTGTYDLNSVKYGLEAGVFVAVGTGGTVLTSPDGINWTPRVSGIAATLNSVTYSSYRRFIAVAADGSIYYSEYASAGATWTQGRPATGTDVLNAVTTGGLYDYSAVGKVGLNLYSD
jgi:hypothetical protein